MTHSVAVHVGTVDWMMDGGTRLGVVSRQAMVPDCVAYRAGSIEARREILRKSGDVAIFIVKEDLTKLGIQPARVVNGFKPNSSYYIAGYGKSDSAREGPRRGATIQGLLCDQARAVSYGCNPEFEFWGDGGKVTGHEDRPDSCDGDSGGPVFDPAATKPAAVVGVTSRAINGTSCGQGGIYVALKGQVLNWVTEATALAASTVGVSRYQGRGLLGP